MSDDIKYLWEIMITGAIAIMGFFGARTINKIDEVEAKAQKASDELKEHQTHVAEHYSTNDTIKRVHDRIDALNNKIDEQTKTIVGVITGQK